MNRIAVVFICDNGYVIPTATAISSLAENKSAETYYTVYIVTADLDEKNMDVFRKLVYDNVSIEIIKANTEIIKGIHKPDDNSHCVATEAALLKFCLPELLTMEDKIIYLDGDLIVQKDLTDLYQTNLASYYIGAVIDSGSIYYKHEFVKKVEHYFNSGVMVLNLKQLRQNNMSKVLIEAKKELKDSSLMDQNIFNLIFDKKVKLLSIKYNFLLVNLDRAKGKYTIDDINQTYLTEYNNIDEIKKDAYIIHYSSKDKPWIYSDIIGADLWYTYYLRSGLPQIRRKMLSIENPTNVMVSIIIPVFNVEKYLEETLQSVLSQTLSNLEIICVNDGSTDDSGKILRKYASKDSRIVLIEQKNAGQSVARNKALEVAKGEYVYFLDSDDLISYNAMESLYTVAKKENLDIVLFDGTSFFETIELEEKHKNYKNAYQRKKKYPKVLNGKTMYTQMVENGDYKVSPCLQFIRKDFLDAYNIRFYEGIIHEDNLFSFYCLMYAERVFHVKKDYFNRRVRPNSVMTAVRSKKNYIGYYVCVREIFEYVHSNKLNKELILQINKQICGYMSSMTDIYYELEENEKKVDLCYPYYYFLDLSVPLRDIISTSENNLPSITSSKVVSKDELIKQYYEVDSLQHHKALCLFLNVSQKIVGGIKCYNEHGLKYTLKRTLEHFGIPMGIKLKKKK